MNLLKSSVSALSLLLSVNAIAQKKNVLFIAVDDLRPELGCYGHKVIKSPNIDKLAQTGTKFSRAYCNIPVSGASRASLLSGIRPNRNRFVDYDCYLDEDVPGATSLPLHFKNNGYQTVSLSKVFHHHGKDHIYSWDLHWVTTPEKGSSQLDYHLPSNQAIANTGQRAYPYEAADLSDDKYLDGKTAIKTMEELARLKNDGKPFFLAVGFLKPHLPFNAPKKYWDMYNREDIKLADNPYKPKDAPEQAMHTFGELRAYTTIPKTGPVPDSTALKMIHGYYASVSFVDAQIGKILDELERLGLAENTIVVLWGDHGWHLGEHGLWCKHCNFEKVLHTPLIVRAPGHKPGVSAGQLVEFVDIFPTLCDLTGTRKPFQLQGNSMVPLLGGGNPQWKDAVFARWIKGETMITKTHVYTEWFDDATQQTTARMLYDLTADPDENVNISELQANRQLVKQMHDRLLKHIQTRDILVIPSGKKSTVN